MTTRTKDSVKSALFEAAFVVLGVILALAANEWRQSRLDHRQAQEALTTILGEIQTNRDAIAESLAYHSDLMSLLMSEHDEDWTPQPREFTRGFISPARTSRTAWDSASEIGVFVNIDYEIVVELSNVYAQQERYEAQARSVGEVIYTEMFRGGTASIVRNYANLAGIISTFSYRERQLLELFDASIAYLERES